MTWTYPEGIRIAEWDETIKARRYIGDGSSLTGIAAGAGVVFPLAQASGGTGATAAVQLVYPLAAASGGTGATSVLQVVYPLAIASGGTSGTTKSAAFDALSPITTQGDLIFGDEGGINGRLASGAPNQVLTMSGLLGVPQWANAAAGQSVVFPLAIASGGTASTTAAAARVALDVAVSGTSTLGIVYPLNVASGGTGATSVLQAVYPLAQASGGTGTTSALQVAYPLREQSGGTASTTSGAARLVLGIADSGALQATITDQGTSGSAYYANVIYNTTSAGVTASSYPIGSILVVYTA